MGNTPKKRARNGGEHTKDSNLKNELGTQKSSALVLLKGVGKAEDYVNTTLKIDLEIDEVTSNKTARNEEDSSL